MMLTDWYFAACANTDRDRGRAWLSIFATLAEPPSPEVLGFALDELDRAGTWPRRFALGHVVRLARDLPADHSIRPRIVATLRRESGATRAGVDGDRLLDTIAVARWDRMLSTVRDVATKLLAERRPEAATPYIELLDGPGPTLVLAALADAATTRDLGWARPVAQREEGDAAAKLVDAALRHEFGRLPYRLALRFAVAAGHLAEPEAIAEHVRRTPGVVANLEPDLLEDLAEFLFPVRPGEGRESAVRALMTEAASGTWYAQIGEDSRETGRAARRVLDDLEVPVGPEGHAVARRVAGRAIWQASLWERAARIHPETAAVEFAKAWAPPPASAPGRQVQVCPVGPRGAFRAHVEDMLLINWVADWRPEPAPSTNLAGTWLLASPWLRPARARDVPQNQQPPWYPALESAVAKFRLAGAAVAAARVGMAAPAEHIVPLARFLLHAASGLHQASAAGGASASLVAYAARVVRGGTGTPFIPLSPLAFLEASRCAPTDSAEALGAAATLVRWLQDSLAGAQPDTREDAWVQQAAEVTDLAFRASVRQPEQTTAACLHRFLVDRQPLFPQLNWTHETAWTRYPRNLLLLPDLPEEAWDRAWPEPKPGATQGEADKRRNFLLFRAIERRMVCRAPARVPSWRTDWRQLLAEVPDPSQLDRFVRLRLFEMLGELELEEAVLVQQTLLETGSAADAERLCRFVFGNDATESAKSLRPTLVNALVDLLDAEDEAQARRDNVVGVDEHISRLSWRSCVEGWVAHLALGEWRNRIRDRRAASTDDRMRARARMTLDIVHRDGEAMLEGGPGAIPFARIHAAVIDAEASRATLVFDDLRIDGAFNGFLRPWSEWQNEHEALAIVRDLFEDQTGLVLLLDLGHGKLPRIPTEGPASAPGTAVLVRLTPNAPRVDLPVRLRTAPRRYREGDLAPGELRCLAGQPVATFQLYVAGELTRNGLVHGRPVSVEDWIADPTADRVPGTVPVIARLTAGGWIPEPAGIADLLVAGEAAGTVTATWIGPAMDRQGRMGALLGVGAVCYFLGWSDLDADPTSLLAPERLSGNPYRRGTRLSFTVRGRPGRPRLGVFGDDAVDDGPAQWFKRFPLHTPEVAHRDAGGWHIQLPGGEVQGDRVGVRWQPRLPPPGVDVAEGEVVAWNPAQWLVTLTPLPRRRLKVNDHRGFAVRWLDELARGQVFRLSVVLARLSNGVGYLALLDEQVPVFVDAETLTLLPLREESPRVNRLVKVTNVGPWRSKGRAISLATQVPGTVLQAGRGRALVAEVPVRGTGGGLWHLLWQEAPDQVQGVEVDTTGLTDWPAVGDAVQARQEDSGWVLEVWSRAVHVRALWEVDASLPASGPGIPVRWDEGRQASALVEVAPGVLAPSVDDSQRVVRGHVRLGPTVGSTRRVVLSTTEGDLVADVDLRGATDHLGYLDRRECSAEVELVAEPSGDGFDIRRQLLGLTPIESPARRQPEATAASRLAQRRQAIDEAIRNHRDVPASLAPDGAGAELVKLRPLLPERPEAPDWVTFEPGHGPFVARPGAVEGMVVLTGDPDGIVRASCRRHVPLSVDAYRTQLRSPALGELVSAGTSGLAYVGPEEHDPVDHIAHAAGLCYRFELEPGRSVLAAATEVRYREEPFAGAARALFPGDVVRRVSFVEVDGHVALRIDHAEIEYSQAHRLYRQATRHRILHLLDVEPAGDGVRIAAVRAMNDREISDAPVEFKHTRAALQPQRVQAVREMLGGAPGIVLGELDTEAFESNQTVLFDPICFGFEERGGLRALPRGRRVFLQVDELVERGNEFLVLMRPPDLLSERGHRPEVSVRRRRFSVREELVRRLFRREAGKQIAGMWVLVALSPHVENDGAPSLSRIDGDVIPTNDGLGSVPTRPWQRLLDWARHLDEVPLVTIVGATRDKTGTCDGLIVEVRPGIYVRIPSDVVDSTDHRPETVVAVVPTGEKPVELRLVRALPSDADLVPPTGRPVNLLPMDELAKPHALNAALERNFWTRPNLFTVEAMPGIKAGLGRMDHGWTPVMPGVAVRVMEQGDPRPAWLAPVGGDFRADPDAHGGTVVRMELVAGDNPRVKDLASRTWQHIRWREVTCMERSVAHLVERLDTMTWWAHDLKTVVWSPADGARRPKLERRTARTGPLLAEWAGVEPHARLRLRYTPTGLPRLALPPGSLTENLPANRDSCVFALAGSDAERRWLYVEVVPGRVAVLPQRQLVHREGLGSERALEDLAPGCFGEGDELTLALAASDPLSVDRVRLVHWRPGVRAVFAGRVALLPIVRVDWDAEAIELGEAHWTLTLPSSRDEIRHRRFADDDVVLLDSSNDLQFVNGSAEALRQLMQAGGVALLVRDGDRLTLAGCPNYHAIPDPNPNVWEGDPLASRLRGPEAGRVVDAAGGALPVVVSWLQDGKVAFHRGELGIPCWKVGDRLPARVLGAFSLAAAMVRVGSQVMPVPHGQLVAGVTNGREVSARLAEEETLLWLRVDEAGHLRPGLEERDAKETTAEVLVDVPAAGGFVCRAIRTRCLHWLPAPHAAWVDLSEHTALFRKEAGLVRAQVDEGGMLSAVALASADAEFRGLRMGEEVLVEPIPKAPPELELVRTVGSRLWLRFKGEIPKGKSVGVVRLRDIGSQRRIEVSAPGNWAPKIELPWLQNGAADTLCSLLDQILATVEAAQENRAEALFDLLLRRAACSVHVEVLVNAWLENASLRSARDGVLNRLYELAPPKAPPDASAMRRMRGAAEVFCRVVESRRSAITEPSILDIAAAWRVALGDDTSRLDAAIKQAPLLGELLAIGWTRFFDAENGMSRATVEALRALTQRARDFGADVPLCAPMPELPPAAE